MAENEITIKYNNLVYRLPPCVLLRIFHFLDLKSLCTCSRVCRSWYNYSNDPSLWRIIDLRSYQINLRLIKKIFSRRVSKNTKEIYIKGTVMEKKKFDNLSQTLLQSIKSKAGRLEKFCLYDSYLRNIKIKWFPGCINNLSLVHCVVPLDWFYELRQSNLFPALEYLDLSRCTRIAKDDVLSICFIKTLKTLKLNGCYRVIDKDIEVIAKNLDKLTKLEVNNCRLSDVSMQYITCYRKNIKSLSICRTAVTELGISALKACLENLVFLDIRACHWQTQEMAEQLFEEKTNLILVTGIFYYSD